MRTTSSSDLRKNLADVLDSVTRDHEPMIVTRERGKPAAIILSLEDFASFEETRHLMSSPANAERLLQSIEELEKGEGAARDLID